MDDTLYTVKTYFKDKNGEEHEKTVVCKGRSCASDLVFCTKKVLTNLSKQKLITVNEVTCTPPLPR